MSIKEFKNLKGIVTVDGYLIPSKGKLIIIWIVLVKSQKCSMGIFKRIEIKKNCYIIWIMSLWLFSSSKAISLKILKSPKSNDIRKLSKLLLFVKGGIGLDTW